MIDPETKRYIDAQLAFLRKEISIEVKKLQESKIVKDILRRIKALEQK